MCLANGEGGTLLLGVEDDGTITGLEPRPGDATDPHKLQAMILNKTEPPTATAVDVVAVEALEVAVVTVAPSAMPVGAKSGRYLRRTLQTSGEPQCVPYPLHEMLTVGLSAQDRDYAATPARGAGPTDLDSLEFDRFRRLCATGRGNEALSAASDADILRALRLSVPGQDVTLKPALGAILLFGTREALERFVPSAELVLNEMHGDAVIGTETLRQPLFALADRAYDWLNLRNSEQEVVVGLHRLGVPRVPHQIIREALANALVHRDYTENSPISVRLTESQFRVSSPGGLPPGITLANLLADSRPRSPILAEAFRRAGLVDRAGHGISLMYKESLLAGRSEPDFTTTNERAVIVTCSTSESDLEVVRFIVEFEDASGSNLSLKQLRILRDLKSMGPQTAPELADSLREPVPLIRGELARLGELGLVEVRGSGRHRRHHLVATFFRLAQSPQCARLLDTDPLQQEQLVLNYVDRYGSISRSQAAELCRLTSAQARTLLVRLVTAGHLELRGERRGARYSRAHARA